MLHAHDVIDSDDDEETHGEAERRYLIRVSKVMNIMVKWLEMDPIQRNRSAILAKSFCRWAKVFPVYQKCDELARQLQERSLVVNTFRDAYLKDVISVRYHLDKIASLKLPDGSPEIGYDMYDLQAVPSTDLRVLIERAKQSLTPTSMQLRESLLQAGIINAAGKDLNPWEKSKSYRKALKSRVGSDAVPTDDSRSLTLFAPRNHRLFVRYCSDCVGFMNFVRDWNREVEESLSLKLEGKAMLAQLNSHKAFVNSLNEIIAAQEKKIVALEFELNSLKASDTWFEKWKGIEESKVNEEELTNKIEQLKHLWQMANFDKESTKLQVYNKFSAELTALRQKVTVLQEVARKERLEKEVEKVARLDLLDRLQEAQVKVERQEEVIKESAHTIMTFESKTVQLESNVAQNHRIMEELHRNLKAKEKEAEVYRMKREEEVVELNRQMQSLTIEYTKKETLVDELRDETRVLKVSNVVQ